VPNILAIVNEDRMAGFPDLRSVLTGNFYAKTAHSNLHHDAALCRCFGVKPEQIKHDKSPAQRFTSTW